MFHETTNATLRTCGTHVLLEAVVDRSPLDTFDLWTRFEALSRLRRQGLVGDAAAVRTNAGEFPRVSPSALTVVDGPDGYAGTVWIRPQGSGASRSSVVLGLEDAAAQPVAARDLARFVEFVLVDGLDRELERVLPCACRGDVPTGDAPAICGLAVRRRGHRDG